MIIDVLVDCYLSNYQMIGMCVDMFDIAVGSYVHTYNNKNLFFLFYFIFYSIYGYVNVFYIIINNFIIIFVYGIVVSSIGLKKNLLRWPNESPN